MEFFGRLRSTMSQNLPGNPLSKDFDVGKQTGSAGPGLLWKTFEASKKSTKQEASIWLFERKLLDHVSKRDRELVIEVLKRGVTNLTKLRHPKILSVIHPLEESKNCFAFATEPVIGSLANLLGNHENLTPEYTGHLKSYDLVEVEIKYGLLQLTEALAFLHKDCKQLHNNVCLESVVVNRNGSWKLAGLDFSLQNAGTDQCPAFANQLWQSSVSPIAQPKLNYMSPESVLSQDSTVAADMFSLGILFYAVYNNGRPFFDACGDMNSYRKNVAALKSMRNELLNSLPAKAREYVRLMLNVDPNLRPDAHQFTQVPFFEDPGVSTLQFMDNLFQLDNLAKSQFYKGLPQVIVNFPHRVNLLRIIPQISEEFANANMVPFVLPTVLQIAEQATEDEFREVIMPRLLPVFSITHPVQINMILIQNLSILMQKFTSDGCRNYVLPVLYRSLDEENETLQELCLDTLPTVSHLLDYSTVKNSIVSKLKRLLSSNCTLKLKVSCLVCLGKLIETMDKWFVLDEVLPILKEMKSKEPAVLMSMLGIYRVAFRHPKLGITKDMLASRVLPHLMPLVVENSLNLKQFNAFMSLIREMLAKVESEQTARLEQLYQMEKEQKTLQMKAGVNSQALVPASAVGAAAASGSMMDAFMLENSASLPAKKPVASTPNVGRLQITSAPSSAAPRPQLSLEEKQRLSRMQDQQDRMQQQGPLNPSQHHRPALTNSATSNGPNDLTSTLLQRNLTSLSQTSQQQQPQQRPAAPSSFPNYNVSTNTQPPQAPRAIGWHSPAAANTAALTPSSLDNLFSMSQQPRPATLHNMMGSTPNGTTPYYHNNNNNFMQNQMRPAEPAQQSVKPLSSQDLADFLD